MRIANVLFYFYMRFGDTKYPLAMASCFSLPDRTILSESCDTVYLCDPMQGREGLIVIPISSIRSVVEMFPEVVINQDGRYEVECTGKFSLMRHAYIELSHYSVDGFNEDEEERENEDNGNDDNAVA